MVASTSCAGEVVPSIFIRFRALWEVVVGPGSHNGRQICGLMPRKIALELNREPDELAPAGAATAAFARPAADAGGVFRQPQRILPSGQARRRAGIRHPRLLPVLARHRHPPPSLGQHRGRWRCRRIYRPGQGIADRIPGRARDPGADLSRLFSHRPRGRALAGLRQHSADRLLLSVRPVRDLSRAALSPDAHGVARRAVLDERLGLDLCVAGVAVGRVDGR